MSINGSIALVTGASSGIGQATAERLAAAGYHVYGTSRRGGQANGRSFEMLPLDVTNEESVDAFVKEVLRRHGRVDLLVNNAGFGVAPAGAEECSIEQARAIFETNFFGLVRMTRAVLPSMRQHGSGRIINIGSVLGFLPMPYGALYAATKHAVEGYSESLDHELRTRGIRVSVIEPAYTKTSFDANFLEPDTPLDAYRDARAGVNRRIREVMEAAESPAVVAEVVLKAASAARPKVRYTAGVLARRLRLLRRFAPAALVDAGIRRDLRLDTPGGACRRRTAIQSSRERRFAQARPPAIDDIRPLAEPGDDMKAFVVHRYGSKGDLQLGEMPSPELREDEVLVQVHAAGVNLLDSKIRSGEFKLILPYRPPFILGHDVAGIVVGVGPRVRQFKPGDAVYARPDDFRIGAFAEYIAVKEDSLALKPAALSMEEAASIPLVGLTAWQALVERAGLQAGQKVFIQAGSGGVGTFAIQLAKHLGATVATTTSSANAALVKSLGADVVIDYRKDDFETILRDYDVVLNSQDPKTLAKSLRVLKAGGKLVSISGPPDPTFGEALNAPWYVRWVMRALSFRIRREASRRNVGYSFLFMKASGGQLREITRLIDSGVIRPVVDRVFPFESTPQAMAYVESGRAKGKVVVKVR